MTCTNQNGYAKNYILPRKCSIFKQRKHSAKNIKLELYLSLTIFHTERTIRQSARQISRTLLLALSFFFSIYLLFFQSLKEFQCFSFTHNTPGLCDLWKEGVTEVLSIVRDTLNFNEL